MIAVLITLGFAGASYEEVGGVINNKETLAYGRY
jgi:hypothetical protein